MRVLLTGGLGYLGGRLSQALAPASSDVPQSHYELVLGTRRVAAPPRWVPDARIVRIDWQRDEHLEQACQNIDAVVHLAGMNAADCASDPVAALQFNGVGTARLLRAATNAGVRRFIYLSTVHVYGAALAGRVDEETCPEPRHPYATSHRAAEDVVRAAQDIQGVVIRLSNSFGAPAEADVPCWSLLINDLCRQAVSGRQIVLRTQGLQRRDFIPVGEACRAIRHLLELPDSSLGDGLFNVGGGWAPSVLEVAEFVADRVHASLGFRPSVRAGSVSDSVGAGDLEFCVQKLSGLGFTPRPEAIPEEINQLIAFCAEHSAVAS